MTGKMHVWPENRITEEGAIVVSAILELPNRERLRLWYRVPEAYAPALAPGCDPLVVGAVFSMMRSAADCIVHGPVSPSLLRNLGEFQALWARWRPAQYTTTEITADAEWESQGPSHTAGALLGFSGGLDSAFSAWHHRTDPNARPGKHLQAGIMVHGFDIGLHESEAFDRAAERSRKMLSSLGGKQVLQIWQ